MQSRAEFSQLLNHALNHRLSFIEFEGENYFIYQEAAKPNCLVLCTRGEDFRTQAMTDMKWFVRDTLSGHWIEYNEYVHEFSERLRFMQANSRPASSSSSSSSSSTTTTTTTTSASSSSTTTGASQARVVPALAQNSLMPFSPTDFNSGSEFSFDDTEEETSPDSDSAEVSLKPERKPHPVVEKNEEAEEANELDLTEHKRNLIAWIKTDEAKALLLLDQYWEVKTQYWKLIDIDELFDERNTYLMLAVQYGRFACAKKLIEYCGANVNKRYKSSEGALEKAIQLGNAEMVQLLIRHGVDVTRRMGNGHFPLSLAVCKGNLPIIKLLVQAKAKVTQAFKKAGRDTEAISLIDLAKNELRSGRNLKTIRKYLKEQTQIELNLAQIVNFEQSEALKNLLEAIKQKNETLALAILSGLASSVLWLNHVYDVDSGKTLVLLAAEKGLFNLLVKLDELGADLNSKDEQHQTILHYAVLAKQVQMLEFLLEKGVSPLSKNKGNFMTPLHVALQNQQWTIAEKLIQAAPIVLFWGNRSGITPVDYLLKNKNKRSAEFEIFINTILRILRIQGSRFKGIRDFLSSEMAHKKNKTPEKQIQRGKKRKFQSEDEQGVPVTIDLEEKNKKSIKKLVSITEYDEEQIREWIRILCGNKKPTDPMVNCFRYAPAMMFALENGKAPTQEVDLSFVAPAEWFLCRNHSFLKHEELGTFSYSWGGRVLLSNYLFPSLTQPVISQETCVHTQRSVIKADPMRERHQVLDARLPSTHFAKLNDTLKQEALKNPEQAGLGFLLFDRVNESNYQLKPLIAGNIPLAPKTIELSCDENDFEFRVLNEKGKEIRHRHLWSEFTEYPKDMPKQLDHILSSRDADFLYFFKGFLKRKNYISDIFYQSNTGHAISFLVSKGAVYFFEIQGYQSLSDEQRSDPEFTSRYIYKENLPSSLYVFWDQVVNSSNKQSFNRHNIYQNAVYYIFRQPKYEYVHLKSDPILPSPQMEIDEVPTDTSYTSHRIANNLSTAPNITASATTNVGTAVNVSATSTAVMPNEIHVRDLFPEINQVNTNTQTQTPHDVEINSMAENVGDTDSGDALRLTEDAFDFDFLTETWENFDLGFGSLAAGNDKKKVTPNLGKLSGVNTGLNLFSVKNESGINVVAESKTMPEVKETTEAQGLTMGFANKKR